MRAEPTLDSRSPQMQWKFPSLASPTSVVVPHGRDAFVNQYFWKAREEIQRLWLQISPIFGWASTTYYNLSSPNKIPGDTKAVFRAHLCGSLGPPICERWALPSHVNPQTEVTTSSWCRGWIETEGLPASLTPPPKCITLHGFTMLYCFRCLNHISRNSQLQLLHHLTPSRLTNRT
jgi:hypothetical protein